MKPSDNRNPFVKLKVGQLLFTRDGAVCSNAVIEKVTIKKGEGLNPGEYELYDIVEDNGTRHRNLDRIGIHDFFFVTKDNTMWEVDVAVWLKDKSAWKSSYLYKARK
jgi:hypothetical protein